MGNQHLHSVEPAEFAVRSVILDADGIDLSTRMSEPATGSARATVLALHGIGLDSAYFDGQAHPNVSLLALCAQLGYFAVAIDRPGYGSSASRFPRGLGLAEQAELIHAAVGDLQRNHDIGAGILLLGHSFGGMVSLMLAARMPTTPILGIDISGCGHLRCAPNDGRSLGALVMRRNWGPRHLYPPGTFRETARTVANVPPREFFESARWTQTFAKLSPSITYPLRITFAEHEPWWRIDLEAAADLEGRFPNSPRVSVDHQAGSGHNISLGWAARSYHLRAMSFLEDLVHARTH